MDARPPRLAFAATHVVKASRVLSWGEKAIWLETYALDMGPEGAWLGNAGMGQRLGLEERTVKNYRTKLHRAGLLVPVSRPGARSVGWVACLPSACIPHERRAAGETSAKLAAILDGQLREMGFGPTIRASPERELRPARGEYRGVLHPPSYRAKLRSLL